MQFVHLSCIKISTISKQSKLSFHLSPFTQEYHRVHPKWFLSLWCIRRKLCTYLAPKLTLSPNRPKQDYIWHTTSRSSIGCVQIDFRAYGAFHANHAPILHQGQHYLQTDRTQASSWASSPRSTNRCVQNGFLDYGALSANFFLRAIRRKLCNYLAPKLTLSPNRPKRDFIWHTSSRSSIGCVQIDFWAYGTFHANRAPILHQD